MPETAPEATAAPSVLTTPAADPAAQTATPAAAAPPAAPQPPEPATDADRIAALEKALAEARAEAGKTRVNAKATAAEQATQETLSKVLGALGLAPDGTKKVSIDDVTTELSKAQADAKAAQRNLAVYLHAGEADPARLLKFTDFLDAVNGLDPSDVEGIKKAVTDTVAANPWLKATQVVPRSGTELAGGTGETGITQQQFDRMTVGERTALYETDRATYDRLSNRR